MALLTPSPQFADVNEKSYKSTVRSVGTSQVEMRVDSTRDAARQVLIIYNDSNNTIYLGPSGVTTTGSTKGYPVVKGQSVTLAIGDVAIYAIAGSASNDVIIQELA